MNVLLLGILICLLPAIAGAQDSTTMLRSLYGSEIQHVTATQSAKGKPGMTVTLKNSNGAPFSFNLSQQHGSIAVSGSHIPGFDAAVGALANRAAPIIAAEILAHQCIDSPCYQRAIAVALRDANIREAAQILTKEFTVAGGTERTVAQNLLDAVFGVAHASTKSILLTSGIISIVLGTAAYFGADFLVQQAIAWATSNGFNASDLASIPGAAGCITGAFTFAGAFMKGVHLEQQAKAHTRMSEEFRRRH